MNRLIVTTIAIAAMLLASIADAQQRRPKPTQKPPSVGRAYLAVPPRQQMPSRASWNRNLSLDAQRVQNNQVLTRPSRSASISSATSNATIGSTPVSPGGTQMIASPNNAPRVAPARPSFAPASSGSRRMSFSSTRADRPPRNSIDSARSYSSTFVSSSSASSRSGASSTGSGITLSSGSSAGSGVSTVETRLTRDRQTGELVVPPRPQNNPPPNQQR